MSRPTRIYETATAISFQPISTTCLMCGQTARVAYHTQRRITTLQGRFCLSLTVRRCHQEACPRYHHPYRPEEEGRWALPYGEYGDVSDCAGWNVTLSSSPQSGRTAPGIM